MKRLWALGVAVGALGAMLGACVSDEPATSPITDGGSDASGAADVSGDASAGDDAAGSDAGPLPPHVGTFAWKNMYPAQNQATLVAHDAAGNLYVVVNYAADFAADGTHSFTYQGSTEDIALIALDPSGKVRWTKQYATSADEKVRGLVSDGTDVYLSGEFNGTLLDFGAGKTVARVGSAAEYEPFLVKLSGVDGTAQWAWNFASERHRGHHRVRAGRVRRRAPRARVLLGPRDGDPAHDWLDAADRSSGFGRSVPKLRARVARPFDG